MRLKIDMHTQIIELGTIDRSLGIFEMQGDLRVLNVEYVQKWLMMDERRIINIQRDFTDTGERLLAIFVIEDSHILRDQAAERIQCQPPDRSFDTAFVQFLNHAVTPLPAEASFREVPTAAQRDCNCNERHQTRHIYGDAVRQRGLS